MRILAVLLLLAACADDAAPDGVDTLDSELAEGMASASDPMVRVALADPIMSDPMLSSRANIDAIRPPAQPYAAPIPATDIAPVPDETGAAATAPAPADCAECRAFHDSLTLAALAARQPPALVGSCAAGLGYAAGWANGLPATLPLHPAGRFIEAAGNDLNGCQLRVVRFSVTRSASSVVDWYFSRASDAGYKTRHLADREGLHMLEGVKPGAAWRAFVAADGEDTAEVTLITNHGG